MGHAQENNEADSLSDYRGHRGTGNSHVEDKNEQRIERHIEDGTRRDASHGINGITLEAHLVV